MAPGQAIQHLRMVVRVHREPHQHLLQEILLILSHAGYRWTMRPNLGSHRQNSTGQNPAHQSGSPTNMKPTRLHVDMRVQHLKLLDTDKTLSNSDSESK